MKTHLVLAISLAACSAQPRSTDAPSYDSVRERLAAEPTQLFISATANAGTLDAAHNTGSGWQSGSAALSISSGAIVASLDVEQQNAELVIATLDLSFEPIDVPESVFGTPAQLTGVRLQLPTATAAAGMTWTDDDDATATLPLELSLSWSLEVNGGVLPLGAQTLPAIPLDVTFGGDGDSVTSTIALHGDGELWSWADLLELTALDVSADAATIAE
jgi:hypothetical protein